MNEKKAASVSRRLAKIVGQLADMASEIRPHDAAAARTLTDAGQEVATIAIGLDGLRKEIP